MNLWGKRSAEITKEKMYKRTPARDFAEISKEKMYKRTPARDFRSEEAKGATGILCVSRSPLCELMGEKIRRK